MIEIKGYDRRGQYLGTKIIGADNITDRHAVDIAFHAFMSDLDHFSTDAVQMQDKGYSVGITINLYMERKPCTRQASSPSSPSPSSC